MRLQRGLGRIDRVQWLASRSVVAPGMGGWCTDMVRCVDEIAVVVGRVEEGSVGRRIWVSKQSFWKKRVDSQKLCAFETCRRAS
jgi:hypothetical protein